MPSSTSHHASFSRRRLILLFAAIVGAPLLWLTALQTGYVLAYQACDERSIAWVAVPTLAAVAASAALAVLGVRGHRSATADRVPMPFLGWMAMLMGIFMLVVLAASAIAPLLLRPCD